jgi:hypothetical protein
MTRYTPRRPQAAPRWFVAAWLTATALITAAIPSGLPFGIH